jgi:prepilin-type N-terminal cleavage/methylation domain-containing protein
MLVAIALRCKPEAGPSSSPAALILPSRMVAFRLFRLFFGGLAGWLEGDPLILLRGGAILVGKVSMKRGGFTVVEILASLVILGILAALLLPAILQAREAARRMQCLSHLRQLGIAVQTYHDVCGGLPYQGTFAPGNSFSGYSVHTRLLAFVERNDIHRQIRYDVGFAAQPEIARLSVSLFRCPSDPNLRARFENGLEFQPSNYGFSIGTWLGIDQSTGEAGDGAFGVNMSYRFSAFTDGLSHTLCASEVKSFQAALVDGGQPVGPDAPVPQSPDEVASFGGNFEIDWGHSQWVSGRTLQTGVTTTFPPNTKVRYRRGANEYDVDFTSARMGPGTNRQGYRIVTARSFHPESVHGLRMDGSVQNYSSSTDQAMWRALGTRSGGEAIGEE